MDDMGNKLKPGAICGNDLHKTDKRFGKHDAEAVIFVFAVIVLLAYLLNFGAVNEAIGRFIGRCFWLMKPYSTIGFDKTPKNDTNMKFVQINSTYAFNQLEDINIAYDKKSIYILESIQDIHAVNIIDVDGEIDEVKCFYSSDLGWMYHLKNDRQKPADSYGLYIYCLYVHDGKQKLSCHQIGQNNFERYAHIKKNIVNAGLRSEKAVTDLKKDLLESYSGNPSDAYRNDILDAINNFKHPGLFVTKAFDIDFSETDFIGFMSNHMNDTFYAVLNRKESCLELRNNFDNKTVALQPVPKATLLTCRYKKDLLMLCELYDGKILSFYSISQDSLKFTLEYSTNIECRADQRPVSLTRMDSWPQGYLSDCFVYSDGKLYYVDPYDKKTEFLKDMETPVDYGNLYYVDRDGNSTILESQDFTCVKVPYRLFHQQLFYGMPDGYPKENTAFYDTHGQYLVAGSSYLDQTETGIFLFSKTHVYWLDTSGIDEPVDEAHVTYEDNRLTIYFMNKNSVYRWQNSEKGIDNLKLRKLDITPEPIAAFPK